MGCAVMDLLTLTSTEVSVKLGGYPRHGLHLLVYAGWQPDHPRVVGDGARHELEDGVVSWYEMR